MPPAATHHVARAIQRKRHADAVAELQRAVVDFRIMLHQPNAADYALSHAAVAIVALEIAQRLAEPGSPEARVMAGAMSALEQCAARGYAWRDQDVPAIDAGLARAVAVVSAARSEDVGAAMRGGGCKT